MKNKAIIGISAAVLTAGLGFGAAQLANADGSSTPPSATSTPSQSGDGSGQSPWGKGHRGEEWRQDLTALAGKLGVDETKLKDAVEAARKATRPTGDQTKPSDQTQAEREAARTARVAAFAKALASELGIDEAKVTSALQELRTEHQAERAAEDKAVIDQAVTDGKLTQTEADAVQKAVDAGIVRVGHPGRGR